MAQSWNIDSTFLLSVSYTNLRRAGCFLEESSLRVESSCKIMPIGL